jgi:hypothetical protein
MVTIAIAAAITIASIPVAITAVTISTVIFIPIRKKEEANSKSAKRTTRREEKERKNTSRIKKKEGRKPVYWTHYEGRGTIVVSTHTEKQREQQARERKDRSRNNYSLSSHSQGEHRKEKKDL